MWFCERKIKRGAAGKLHSEEWMHHTSRQVEAGK
jgi:hypothetical protein